MFMQFDVVAVNPSSELISWRENVVPIELSAERGTVLADQDRVFLYSKQADEPQPIASITKLMTALVFLDNNPGWEKVYKITPEDQVNGGRLHLFLGEKVKVKDLFHVALIASDNGATTALVHSTDLTKEEFVKEMNEKAKALGLSQTQFVDPTGLSDDNISTAREVAWLARTALKQADIKEIINKKDYTFKTINGREKRVESTDYLLFDSAKNSFQVIGGKTGYTDGAGYCFVGRFQNEDGRELISVVLNSDGLNERFRESKRLINWSLNSYNWKD